MARFGVPAALLERGAEAEQGVIVGRRVLGDGLELLAGVVEALRAEVRAAERLANRVLARLEVACPAQRDDGSMEVALREERRASLKQLIGTLHTAFSVRREAAPAR